MSGAWPGEGLPCFLGRVASLGRSSRHELRRHAALRRAGAAPEGEPRSAARRARLLRLRGEEQAAEAAFREALARAPGDPEAGAGLWELLAGRGRAPAPLIDSAVAAQPRRAAWRAWRGLWRLLRGEEGERADLEAAARARGPAAVIAAAGLGARARRLRRPREALEWLDEAVRRAPREGWLRRLRAKARLDAGEREGFLADCEAEMLRDEGVGTLAYALGVKGACAPALLLARAERAARAEPRAYWALALRGEARRAPEIGDKPGSAADLQAAAALAPRPGWLRAHLARALQDLGDENGARAAADAAVAAEPGCGWIRAWRAELRRKLGELEAAEADAEAALALDPDYELAWAARGAIRLARGRAQAGRADLELALALEPALGWARRLLAGARA